MQKPNSVPLTVPCLHLSKPGIETLQVLVAVYKSAFGLKVNDEDAQSLEQDL